MLCKLLIVFTLVSHAVSDSCVRYTFEENYNNWLEHQWGSFCDSFPAWIAGKYSDLDVTSPNERSNSFITPLSSGVLSCVSSFIFTMTDGGTIEVNTYMKPTQLTDQITILVHLHPSEATIVGQGTILAYDPNFVEGWYNLRIPLTGPPTYEGYISILGMASPNSTVLVDSFRYIPPSMDESECTIYEIYENLPTNKKMNHPN
ncbi:hypothetical protein PYW08_002858 [Mythimna loreyi]|uniref:Uncharacterized protein n=1 Tax=Mythimna loreyi TaxID=667449 RepID=A0ACC2QN51_9NEOP|nr:hypothetical protein PYW08_002858 [Mythimna loreyi]